MPDYSRARVAITARLRTSPGTQAAIAACLACALFLAACSNESALPLHTFYAYDKHYPLNADVRPVRRTLDRSLFHVTYSSTNEQRVTGLFSMPEGMAGPVPAIIFAHGLYDSKSEDYMQFGNQVFLENGYAVLRIDAHNHGERKRLDLELDLTDGYPYWSRNVVIQTIFDLRRAVDFLLTRPEIDPDRIGYFGASFGGLLGIVFAGVDDRVKVPVIALAGGGLNLLFGARALSPSVDDFLSPIEPLNFVAGISPRPLLMINAERDETVPAIATRLLYARAEDPKRIIWYDTDHHEIPKEKAFAEAVIWFDRYLRD